MATASSRTYQRDKYTGYEEAFLYFFFTPLRYYELDAESDNVGHGHARKYGKETVEHHIPELELIDAESQLVLVSGVVHSEKEARHQGEYDDNHRTLGIHAVVNMHSVAWSGCCARGVEECFKTVEN